MGRRRLTTATTTTKRADRKTRSHDGIVGAAAQLLREKGIQGMSVDTLMAGAGLTRGGFYAHFDDKDALVAAGLDRAFAEQRQVLLGDDDRASSGRALLERMVTRYLSSDHLDHPALGCPVPPLAAEIARGPKNVKRVFRANLLRLVQLMKERIGGDESEMLVVCAMAVGAMTIARAVGDDAMANEMLGVARRHLLRIGTGRNRNRRRRRT